MAVKTVLIPLDEREYLGAVKKKGKRTWKQVLMDGLDKQEKD